MTIPTQEPRRWLDAEPGGSDALRDLLQSAVNDSPSAEQLGRLSARLGDLLVPGAGADAGAGDGDVGDGGGGELPGVSEATQAGTSVAARAGASVAVKGGASVLTKVLVAAGAVAVGGGGFQAGRVYESAAIAERTAVAASAERTVVPQERPEPSPVAVPVPVLDEPSPAIAAPPPAVAQPRPAARPAVVHRAPEAQPEPLPTDEPNLLDAALRAMRGGQSTRALEITAEHRRLHPNGVLAQEREVIAIEALIRLGRGADAHAAANRFRDAYPTSGHLLRVDSLVREVEP